MRNLMLLLLVASLFSCSSKEMQKQPNQDTKTDMQEVVLPEQLSQEDILKRYFEAINLEFKRNHIFYITEMDGCGYCINESIEYAMEENKNNITFIFSCDNKGVKNLINKLGTAVGKDNVLIDNQNYAYQYSVTHAKPTAFFITSDSIEKFEFIPDNFPEGFEKIKNF